MKEGNSPMKKTIYFIQALSEFCCGCGENSTKIEAGAIQIGFNSVKINDTNFRVLGAVPGDISEEMKLHQRFSGLRIKGEWYKSEPELLDFIGRVSKEANTPINLRRAIKEFKGKDATSEGKECHNWIKIANNLPVSDEPEELMSIDSAARLLGISSQTLRNWEEQGKIEPQYTTKGHRRYTRSQVLEIRKKQMHQQELLLPGITPSFLIQMVQEFVQSFDPLERVNLTLSQDAVLGKVRIAIDSADGLTTVSKSFNIKN
jgi:hypothetical protein